RGSASWLDLVCERRRSAHAGRIAVHCARVANPLVPPCRARHRAGEGKSLSHSYPCVRLRAVVPIISISNLTKTYASGLQALKNINLEIRKGEIFALLGPNGAGKTTLISVVCGIVRPTEGVVLADGHD